MKKIALVGTLVFNDFPDPNKKSNYIEMFEIFMLSAKKHFMKNHDVDFILLTNTLDIDLNEKVNSFVKKVIYPEKINNFSSAISCKIFGLEMLSNNYDFVFSSDVDQIFVSNVNDSDLLNHDFSIMSHFFSSKYKDVLPSVNNAIEFTPSFTLTDDYIWPMGNFFGGKQSNINELILNYKDLHNKLKNKKHKYPRYNYYALYPDEMFLGDYCYSNNIKYQLLTTVVDYRNTKKSFFLSDFIGNVNEILNIKNVKLLHNTKKNMELLRKLKEKY